MVTVLTPENFEKEVDESKVPVIVDFWASWCGPCQMMAPTFEKLSEDYRSKLKFAKLDVEEYGSYAAKFGIMGIPALVIFEGKREKTRIVGFSPEAVLREKIDSALN